MEDAELVLKELRIDWETVLTEEYNPLKQALEIKRNSIKQSNYRNIYHRVERVMEKIIEETYKGFSDSVLSYMECYNLTSNGLKEIKEMIAIVERLKGIRINTEDIYKNFEDTELLKIKNKICEELVEIKNKHERFKRLYKEGRIYDAAINLQEVRDIIKKRHLYNIKGIDAYGLEVEGDVREVCENIFGKLDTFIYADAVQFKEYFRIIVVLNRILKYDRYVYLNLEKNIFKCIEEIIYKINKETEIEEESVDKAVNTIYIAKSSTTVCHTYESSSKITCFYKEKPNLKHKKKGLKNLLVEQIVNKINTIKHNLSCLRKLSLSSFENLDEQTKDYYGEYKGFMIFCNTGKKSVERIVQKVINTFIDVYADNDKKDINVGEFENINILDSINYEEEFDEKYPIYSRMANNKSINDEKEEDFTLIFRPSIDICIDLYEYIREESIKQRCMKYINHKGEDVVRKVLIIFQEHRWDRNNYSTGTLWFTEPFLKTIQEVENIILVFGVVSLDKAFALVKRRMKEKYETYFSSPVIAECLKKCNFKGKVLVITDRSSLNVIERSEEALTTSDISFSLDLTTLEGVEKTDISRFSSFVKVEEKGKFKYFLKLSSEVKSILKDFIVNRNVNIKELLRDKTKYEHILFSVNSLIELGISEIAYHFAFAFKIDILLEIFFYFDVYYREGVFKNRFYILKIVKIVQDVYENIDLSEVFELLNYYIINNSSRLNVKKKEDIVDFSAGVKLLDECLSDVSEKFCLKRSVVFIEEEMLKFN